MTSSKKIKRLEGMLEKTDTLLRDLCHDMDDEYMHKLCTRMLMLQERYKRWTGMFYTPNYFKKYK